MPSEREPDPCYPSRVRTLGALAALAFMIALSSCGGSSSETPPPLEPLPANVKYNRAATSLPGELGTETADAGAPAPEPERTKFGADSATSKH